eukprot:g3976.t1
MTDQQNEEDAWIEVWDENQKRNYYFNEVTNESVWIKPPNFKPKAKADNENHAKVGGDNTSDPNQSDNKFADNGRAGDINGSAGNDAGKIYLSNLPFDMRQDGLNDLFAKFGRIVFSKVCVDRNTQRSRGFGFLTFERAEDAAAAIKEMHGLEVGGRTITVEKYVERRGHRGPPVGGGPSRRWENGNGGGYDNRRNDYNGRNYNDRTPVQRNDYNNSYDNRGGGGRGGGDYNGGGRGGPSTSPYQDSGNYIDNDNRAGFDRTPGPPRGSGNNIDHSYRNDYPDNNRRYDDRNISNGGGSGGGYNSEARPSNALFVRNLDWKTDNYQLAIRFSRFGEVESTRVVYEKTEPRRSRGFGFVNMVRREDAIRAKEAMDGTELCGRPMYVMFYDREKQGQGGVGGGPPQSRPSAPRQGADNYGPSRHQSKDSSHRMRPY